MCSSSHSKANQPQEMLEKAALFLLVEHPGFHEPEHLTAHSAGRRKLYDTLLTVLGCSAFSLLKHRGRRGQQERAQAGLPKRELRRARKYRNKTRQVQAIPTGSGFRDWTQLSFWMFSQRTKFCLPLATEAMNLSGSAVHEQGNKEYNMLNMYLL